MIWGAVIVAAGRGTRFGRPKQLAELAGKPMIAWSIEAFAAGTPVVASDIAGYRDVVGSGGVLVPRGDATRLAETLWEAQRAGQRSSDGAVIRVASAPGRLSDVLGAAIASGGRGRRRCSRPRSSTR